MKRNTVLLVTLFLVRLASAQFVVEGGNKNPYLAVDDSKNKLQVYLLSDMSNVRITYTSSDNETHQWYKYQNKALEATPVSCVQNGNESYITEVSDGYGYFVGSPTDPKTNYVWIIDYSLYAPQLLGLKITDDEYQCESLKLGAEVNVEPVYYYLPLGVSVHLDRTYHLQYNTLEWNEDNLTFLPKTVNLELNDALAEILIDTVPLINTPFTLTGDDFSKQFGREQSVQIDEYQAVAVEAHSTAVTNKEFAENEKQSSGADLGGSAPIEYTFTAYANEPVATHYIWKVFELDSITGIYNPIVRYPEKILNYTFDRWGNYYVQLEVIDSKSVCSDTLQIHRVRINNTIVYIPNAFSPGSSIGVNDEYKITFSSITSFKASIFNRQGNLLFQWSDPSKGWDGRVNGKFVPTGVYYIIVEYTDSQGKRQHKSRDINILRSNK
jgi:gliding motility-associated-like protein